MATINSMFGLAIDLRDEGEFEHAIGVLKEILRSHPNHDKAYMIYAVIAGVYSDLEEWDSAMVNFRTATELNPASELASLGLYVSLAESGKDVEAVHELIRYLETYPAELYRDSLEELLTRLSDGYMIEYQEQIRRLAEKNGL